MRIAQLICAGLVGIASVAAPAHADIAGRYETVDDDTFVDMEMTLEINDTGQMRMQMKGMPGYYLLRDDDMYIVSWQSGETSVVRLADMMTIANEAFERMGVDNAFADKGDDEGFIYSEMGQQTVGGREGTAYGVVSEEGDEGVWASLVMSSDPRLAPIGQAMARAQEAQIRNMGSMGAVLQNMSASMQDVLRRGAPLKIMTIELTDVSFDEIPDERFALPSEALTIDELREASRPAPPPPTLPLLED